MSKNKLRIMIEALRTRQVILLAEERGHVQRHQHDSQRPDFRNASVSQQTYPTVLHIS